jgi:flagellar biosynthesis protein FlhG
MDQAADLRTLARQVAAGRAPACGPRRIVVFGGTGGAGTTTVAVNLATLMARQNLPCLLCDAAGSDIARQLGLKPRHTIGDVLSGNIDSAGAVLSGPAGLRILAGATRPLGWDDACEHAWNRMTAQWPLLSPRVDFAIIDAGCRPDACARRLWRTADRVLLVTGVESAAIMNAYASIKVLHDPARNLPIGVLVNRPAGEASVDEAQQRLIQACRRFLGLSLRGVGVVPEEATIPACSTRGEAFVLAMPACAASLGLRPAVRFATGAAARQPALA